MGQPYQTNIMEGNMMLLKLWAKTQAFMYADDGATAIEYGLIAAGIAVAISAAVVLLGTSLTGVFTNVTTTLNANGG